MTNFGRLPIGCVFAIGLFMVGLAYAETDRERSFQTPPVSARPWAYWWWLNSNLTREGITRDLEEMHRQGIQGVLIFNAGGGNTPAGPKFLSPEWNGLFEFALSELSRLGMEASVNLCDGWDSGGPWIPAEAANKKLVWSETQVDGPRAASLTLPHPPTIDGFYRDVAVLAVREKCPRPVQPAEIRASSAVGGYCDEKNWPPADLADGDPNTIWRGRGSGARLRRPGSITSILSRLPRRRFSWPRPPMAVPRSARCKRPTTALPSPRFRLLGR